MDTYPRNIHIGDSRNMCDRPRDKSLPDVFFHNGSILVSDRRLDLSLVSFSFESWSLATEDMSIVLAAE